MVRSSRGGFFVILSCAVALGLAPTSARAGTAETGPSEADVVAWITRCDADFATARQTEDRMKDPAGIAHVIQFYRVVIDEDPDAQTKSGHEARDRLDTLVNRFAIMVRSIRAEETAAIAAHDATRALKARDRAAALEKSADLKVPADPTVPLHVGARAPAVQDLRVFENQSPAEYKARTKKKTPEMLKNADHYSVDSPPDDDRPGDFATPVPKPAAGSDGSHS